MQEESGGWRLHQEAWPEHAEMTLATGAFAKSAFRGSKFYCINKDPMNFRHSQHVDGRCY